MKRLVFPVAATFLALASFVLAQPANQATLRTPAGDRPVATRQVDGSTYFAADEVVAALGGSVTGDANGFKATLNNTVAAFGPDSRFGVVRDDLIEMPVPPIVVAGLPYVPWQFFSGFLGIATQQEAVWDGRVLTIRARQQSIVTVQMTVTNIQGISKIVLTLSAPA